MKLVFYLTITMTVAFMASFWIVPILKTRRLADVRWNQNKFYLSCIFALIMGLLEVMIYDSYRNHLSLFWYLSLGLSLYICVFLFRNFMGDHESGVLREIDENLAYHQILAEKVLRSEHASLAMRTMTNQWQQTVSKQREMLHRMMQEKEQARPTAGSPYDSTYSTLLQRGGGGGGGGGGGSGLTSSLPSDVSGTNGGTTPGPGWMNQGSTPWAFSSQPFAGIGVVPLANPSGHTQPVQPPRAGASLLGSL